MDLPTLCKEGGAKISPVLTAADGKLTPEVHKAYLDWAEQTILQELRQDGQTVKDDCLTEVDQDDTVRDAVFGAVFPPDPSILQNYAELRSRLGMDMLARYRSLVVAIAVARRTRGVEKPEQIHAVGRDYQDGFWTDESLHAPGSGPEQEFVHAIVDFLKEWRVSVADLYQTENLQRKLKAELAQRKIADNFIDEVRTSAGFGERLKYAMVLLGQRPGARDPKPDAVTWIRHLIARNEATPSSTPTVDGRVLSWPQFPLDKAPWPLLMPLAHTVPLSEADYIWEAFQGEHGPDRYHTYGPYRGDDDLMPDSLRPSRWFWDAWPDRIIHGGMCVPISKGTVDLYTALGKPAMWAGQPGHANLISFQYVSDTWTAEIEQAFAGGPDVTSAQWYFDEEPGTMLRFRDLYYWPGAEYHLGLALGMNVGLSSYMDTRIAANVFRLLPPEEKRSVGIKLLRSALQANPYNPDIWYRLAEQTSDPLQGMTLIEAACKADTSVLFPDSGRKLPPMPGAAGARDQYWRTLPPFLTQYALLSHAASGREEDRRRVYGLLKSVPGVGVNELTAYVEKAALAAPAETAMAAVTYDRSMAREGDPYGQVRMGQRYRDGDGVALSAARARDFFAHAASGGDATAAVLLDSMYPTVPADQITVTASNTYSGDQAPNHLIDGAGMLGAVHDNEGAARTMWQTAEHPTASTPVYNLPPSPAWVRFDFAKPVKLDSVLIWNHNQAKLTDRGFRDTRLYGTTDGARWFPLTSNGFVELSLATGEANTLPAEIPLETSEKPLKAVIIAATEANGNYGGDCYGLSAVRFVLHRLPEVIPARMITVTASATYSPMQAVQHLIDGSGMRGSFHDDEGSAGTMWHTAGHEAAGRPAPGLPPSPAWVRFNFVKPVQLDSLLIWNHNQQNLTDRGFRKVRIYGSTDNVTWRPLTLPVTTELPRASGTPFAEPITVSNSRPDESFKSVIIVAEPVNGNYGGSCYGLSAVRFVIRQ